MTFWLGTHEPCWLARHTVPLFLSAIRLRLKLRKDAPPAVGPWALDSGGFSELTQHGTWTIGPRRYVDEVRRWQDKLGGLVWAATQDWMCEPFVLAKTGKSLAYHQHRTIGSWHDLKAFAPDVPWVPVLQGYHYDDYFRHREMYEASGVRLGELPVVGVGSVCRREDTTAAEEILRDLYLKHRLKLHGFGFKTDGLMNCARYLVSADSLAWSDAARRRKIRLPGCPHKNCNSCYRWASQWRDRVLASVDAGRQASAQPALF